MRYFALFLLVYVLFLSVRPCCTDEPIDTCADTEISLAEELAHHEESACEEPCSPFFVCGTCLGFAYSPIRITIPFQILSFQKIQAAYFPPAAKEIALGIWQPPKLT
ncbi:hypothetical protein QWY31_10875 [Cytophagales bacterium LB-30]|uniref:Secreted protein n=1 Tax=Shiella aurantiaca TaxID=3058365 RepID=A0ABT8F6E8_9BACT|nr:hypothetical protein [Shiella aurantiaca]MDN4166007.1 hypothetical protein [Shiella aurantiaca]